MAGGTDLYSSLQGQWVRESDRGGVTKRGEGDRERVTERGEGDRERG